MVTRGKKPSHRSVLTFPFTFWDFSDLKIHLKIIGTNYEKRSRKCEVTKERLT